MKIKNTIMSLFMVMVLCLSAVPALATEPLNAMPQFTIAVGDTAPASDLMLATNILPELSDAGYDTSAVGAVKLFSEVNGQMLDNKVTLVIYEGGAIIIVGATSPASHAMFAASLTFILQVQGTYSRTILSSEVPSTDLIDLFDEEPEPQTCTDSDTAHEPIGSRNYYSKGTVITRDETVYDYCKDSDTLVELTCDEAGGKAYEYTCPNGCRYGKCYYPGYYLEFNKENYYEGDVIEFEIRAADSGTAKIHLYIVTPDDEKILVRERLLVAGTRLVEIDTEQHSNIFDSTGEYLFLVTDSAFEGVGGGVGTNSRQTSFVKSVQEVPIVVPVCRDTDGRNEFVRGTTTGTTACTVQENCNTAISSTDFCNGNTLNEFVCDIDSRYNVERRYVNFIECEYGCSNGACLREPQETNCKVLVNGEVIRNVYATDRNDCYSKTSFGSRNCIVYNSYFMAGRNTLEQYYDETDRVNSDVCYAKEEVEEVPEVQCRDTDGGKDYYTRGEGTGLYSDDGDVNYIFGENPDKASARTANMGYSIYYDHCFDSSTSDQLNEAFCDDRGRLQSVGYGCPNGCRDGVCLKQPEEEQEYLQEIVSISGNKGVYAPKEKIALTIKGIETKDGSPASREEGWNVQYYTYDARNPDNYMQEYVPTGNYNAQFDDKYWYANYWAPEEEGKYYTEVVLYCSRDNSECRDAYGGHGLEWREKIYFTVDDDAVSGQGKPDLVIKNLRYIKKSPDLATLEFDIHNIGDAPIDDWFAIAVYVDGRIHTHTVYNEQKPGTSYTYDADAVIPLMPGDRYHKTLSNYYWLTSGGLKRTVTVVVDRFEGSEEENPVYEGFRDNMIDESNEGNNKVELRIHEAVGEAIPEIGYSKRTFWINDWRKTEMVIDNREHVFAVSDIHLEKNKCSVYIDGTTQWIDEGDSKVINGVRIRLDDVEMTTSRDIGRYEMRQCRITVFGEPEEAVEIIEEAVVVPEHGIIPVDGNGECPGCLAGSVCLSYGIRFLHDAAPSFCDIGGRILEQKEDDKSCQNDYECLSNTCGNGKCQDFSKRLEALEREMKETKGIVNRILNWLKRWFGGGSEPEESIEEEQEETEEEVEEEEVPESASPVIENDFGVLTYDSTTTSTFCDFVEDTKCEVYNVEYRYNDKSARIVAGVEIHPRSFTNHHAIDGIMGEFGKEDYTIQEETYEGNNIYLFTGGQYPDQQMLAAWYSGKTVIALYVDNSPAVLTDSEVDDVFEDSLLKYYLAKYPSDLIFE